VQDCAILLQSMAGYDPTDPASANRPVPDFSAGLGKDAKGIKIGVVRHWHETDAPVADAVQAGIDGALAIWQAQGAEIIDVVLPSLYEFQACCSVILTSEAYAVHEPWMKTRFNDYGERLRMRLATGALMTSGDYVQALRRRLELCTIVAQATKGIDILITAGAQAEAPLIAGMPLWVNADKPGFTAPFNVLGWPAMAICSGFGVGGLPVAIQIAAKPFQEAKLFQVADAFEQATNFRAVRPSLVVPAPALAAGLAAAGLTLRASDMAGLGEVVADLAATAASLKGDRSYAVEPANVFSLRKGA
jgi:aspartyl-tRNA(Asn)/glutamyl-tRNA(Gln) amidotransferase subunit A